MKPKQTKKVKEAGPIMPCYSLTQISTQDGDGQDAFEVYADESREQTVAFVFDEDMAKILVRAVNNHEKLVKLAHIVEKFTEIMGPQMKLISHKENIIALRGEAQDALRAAGEEV